jgi:lambda family phage minor tail protein L
LLNLPAIAIIEKNKLSSTGAWLVLLEVIVSPTMQIQVCHNTEDITWNGTTWVAFPFEIGDIEESGKGELPQFEIRVSNVTRVIQSYLEEANGGVGAKVTLRVIHSDHLDQTTAFLEEKFMVKGTSSDAQWVTFTVGGAQNVTRRFPGVRVMKNFCPFKYGKIQCGVPSTTFMAFPECNRSLTACRERGNSKRYGGVPSIPQGGFYA